MTQRASLNPRKGFCKKKFHSACWWKHNSHFCTLWMIFFMNRKSFKWLGIKVANKLWYGQAYVCNASIEGIDSICSFKMRGRKPQGEHKESVAAKAPCLDWEDPGSSPDPPHPTRRPWHVDPAPLSLSCSSTEKENNSNKTFLSLRAVVWTEAMHGKAFCKQQIAVIKDKLLF